MKRTLLAAVVCSAPLLSSCGSSSSDASAPASPVASGGSGGSAGASSAGAAGANAAGANVGGSGGSETGGAAGNGETGGTASLPTKFGGDRPATLYVPAQHDPTKPAPLVVMLHGYSATGNLEELYLNLTAQADAVGFLYLHPDGKKDALGNEYWNATDACCDFYKSGVDDSAYLIGLVHEVQAAYDVDPKRIYFVGHSNGGFMSHRMACEHADTIAAIVSLAGEMPLDASTCNPSAPVAVLQIQGTADAIIPYAGGTTASSVNPGGAPFPSARTTIEDWAKLDGCSLDHDDGSPPLDLDSSLAGNETTVSIYANGCTAGGHAELWTIQGGTHIPTLSANFTPDLVQFLMAHPKP